VGVLTQLAQRGGAAVSPTPVIEADGVSLAYRLSRNRSTSFKDFAIRMLRRQISYEQLWALRGVSFQVRRGEIFAIIGPNGAGKSTLMKVMARVLPPAEGRIVVRGALAPMIELGAGFNPELTALENIILYGTILGRTPQVMRQRVQAIAEWGELTEFLDVPIRGYSSGMLARLGFSVATDLAPDILLVDEVLSVGDAAFARKSTERIEAMIATGTAVVLVTHALSTVREMADRVMWLERGRVRMIGEPAAVVDAYERAVLPPGDLTHQTS